MLGAAATSIALAIAPGSSGDAPANHRAVVAREIGEVKARLKSLEATSRRMQAEIREDIKDLRVLIQSSLGRSQRKFENSGNEQE